MNDPHFCYEDGVPVNKCTCGHHHFDHLMAHEGGDKWVMACTVDGCNCRNYRAIAREIGRAAPTALQ